MVVRNAYLIGGGIASLASAAYLIREGRIEGSNIHIFEELDITGGSLDGIGDPDQGYSMRGGRMLNFSYGCTYDLFSFVPSLSNPKRTVLDEIQDFNKKVKTHAKSRLVRNGEVVDSSSMGFSYKDRFDLLEILVKTEEGLGTKRITDCFAEEFFKTNFWYMWATMFAFQPWHSAVEFKRYLHRFMHEFPRINTLAGVDRTPFNQYESLVLPLEKWLRAEGVEFKLGAEVVDLEFLEGESERSVSSIIYRQDNHENEISIDRDDMVFVTNGSMTANSTLGSMTQPAPLKREKVGGSFALWERIARRRPEFGRPAVFDDRIDESKWLSFTVTLKDPTFFNLMEKFTGNSPGTGALVTFTDSNWLMSVVLAYQPHFFNQPQDVQVFWGYGLYVDKPGNFVKKKMADCNGEEIMTELCSHLRFTQDLPKILQSANCIPCMMPYITSQFLTRAKGDRPQVVPDGWKNLAFVSQFCEQPDDVVFTVEYSVRAAQTAVYTLLGLNKSAIPVYDGQKDFSVLFNALKTTFKPGDSNTHEGPTLTPP